MTSPKIDHFVILSGAYVGSEIASEFGHVPPTMLPIGGVRLYEHQIAFAASKSAGQVTLSLPADYHLPPLDRDRLKASGVRVIRVPTNLALVQSLSFVLEVLDVSGQVALLHGDTLIEIEENDSADVFFVSETDDDYDWGLVVRENGRRLVSSGGGAEGRKREVICGFFLFSDGLALREICAVAPNFIEALNAYADRFATRFSTVRQWLDLGHLNLYYTARRDLLVTRAFNTISYRRDRLVKSSEDRRKMQMEISWYQKTPPDLRHYLPQFFTSRERSEGARVLCEYEIEYLFLPNVAEITLFGDAPPYRLSAIIDLCIAFLDRCGEFQPDFATDDAATSFCELHFDYMIREKTFARLEAFQAGTGFDIDQELSVNGQTLPGARRIAEDMVAEIAPTRPEHLGFWHGDLFFGNILFDARARAIRLVDPRGEAYSGCASIHGDRRYDQAKLLHSLVGRYDEIIAGRYRFDRRGTHEFALDFGKETRPLDGITRRAMIGDRPLLNRETMAITVLLFLSMLPLHGEAETRQACLLANAARLYAELQEGMWDQ